MEDFFSAKGNLVTENVKQTEVVDVQPKADEDEEESRGNGELRSCKVLQRKLEMKAERAKKGFHRLHDSEVGIVVIRRADVDS